MDFLVKDREGWEEYIKPLIVPDQKRIDFELYRKTKRHAAEFINKGLELGTYK